MRKISLTVISLSLLTGCGSPVLVRPTLTPVDPHITTMVKCGEIHMIKRGNKIVISIKDANCFKAQLKRCALDRKKLLIANRANVTIIEKLNGARR